MPDGTSSSLAEVKISELPVATAANATDQLEANQAGTSRSITVGQIGSALGAAGGVVPGGAAGGDLSGSFPNPTVKASVALTGNPTAPTPPVGDNDTSIATTAFVRATTTSINVRNYGAVGDGIHDDTAALQAAFTAISTGAPGILYVPSGTYLISGPVGVTMASDMEIVMETDAIIKGAASFPATAKMWQFLAQTPGTNFKLKISGGKFDGSLRPAGTPGNAPDMLSIAGTGIAQCDLQGIWFYSNADRTGTAGDSCLFFGEGHNLSVTRCIFQGATDAGIYLSGDTTQTLGDGAIFYGNKYRECATGLVSKRQWQRMTVWGEDVQGCGTGIATGEADVTLLPGLDITIAYCNLRSCTRGINARWSNGAKIVQNKVTDYGVSYVTGPPVGVADSGILLSGSSDCLIDGNSCVISGYTPHASATAIRLSPLTINAVTQQCVNNLISNNQINTVSRGIAEDDANQDFNRYIDNVVRNASVNNVYVILGANSTVDKGLENNRREFDYASVSLGGSRGAEALRVIKTANDVNFWQVTGSATGGIPSITATGTDADINTIISTRGVGSIIFGSVGSESMRIARVASQVNRLDVTGAIAGNPPIILSAGGDTNIHIRLTPKGTGNVILTLANVGNFTSDSLAAAGGVPLGGIYRNASALQIRTV